MPETLSITQFLHEAKKVPILDVRSPLEFESGHIPGAINLPLFTNEERADIGTIYKKSGKDAAVAKGMIYVTPKLAGFVEVAQKNSHDGQILVHCWRGGMRSGSMSQLFEDAGLKSAILTGGYKAFRNHVLESFSEKFDFRVIGGETGSGKTEILHAIGKTGEQILDLEAIAHHRGSSFGAIGQLPQPTSEQFENNLFDALKKLDSSKRIWVEDESQSIGRVFIPNVLFALKINAPCYRVKVPFEIRVQRLVKDYGSFPKEILSAAVLRIQKRLGGLATQQALDAIENGDLAETVRLTLFYYDRAYDFPQSQRKYQGVTFVECDSGDPFTNAQLILVMVRLLSCEGKY